MSDRDSQKYYWLKTDKDLYNSYKIRSLMSEKKGDTYLVIYEQLCCESLNYAGELRYSENRPYSVSELAYVINRPAKLLIEALDMLGQKELIEILPDGTIYIPGVQERVGCVSGQTLRKQRSNNSNSAVNFTNELPKKYRNETVISTPEIRDKSLENIREKEETKQRRKRDYPTFEEVAAYCKSRNSTVDPKVFYEYFTADESKPWVDSKGQPVKNWKQKIITWEQDGRKKKPQPKAELPTYDASQNKKTSYEEYVELMTMMGKDYQSREEYEKNEQS